MAALTTTEEAAIEVARGQPMLDRVLAWSAINSGTRNLSGVAAMAAQLADTFSALPGEITLVPPAPVESIGTDGIARAIEHGRHFHLAVRPDAAVQLLLTGHMDTVYPVDHAFQATHWIDDATLG
ncbi:MAG: hypothetical protein K2P79_09145, partial [Sphingomonas sp.]|nr:hypothetical protein [Sphingomonas sp.]